MTEQPADWRAGLQPSVVDEVQHIKSAFARREAPPGSDEGGADGPISIGVARKDDQIDYLYAEGQILVLDQYLPRVLDILGLPTEDVLRRDDRLPIRPVTAGTVQLVLPPPGEGESPLSAPDVVTTIDRHLGPGIATPDHVLTVAPGVTYCPATEPEAVYADTEPFPPVCYRYGGAQALVYVADTGLMRDAGSNHQWLSGVRVVDQSADYEDYQPPTGGRPASPPLIPPYTGHGTFVAGVLRCMATIPARCASPRRATAACGAQAGRPRSPTSCRSARSALTGAAGRRSATSARGSTYTRQAGISSTPTRLAHISVTSRPTRVLTERSMAWPSGAARRSRRR